MDNMELIIHHTASSRDKTTLRAINSWHKKRWPNFKSSLGYYIGYHYVIGKDWIKQTRKWGEEGAHCYGHNKGIGISLTGNFETEEPNEYQWTELKKLVVGLMAEFHLKEGDVYLHKELSATLCPGKNLTRERLFNKPPEPSKPTKTLDNFKIDLINLIKKYD